MPADRSIFVAMLDYQVIVEDDERLVIGPAPYGWAAVVVMLQALFFPLLGAGVMWWFWPRIGLILGASLAAVWCVTAVLLFLWNGQIKRGRFDLRVDSARRTIDLFDDADRRRARLPFSAVGLVRIEHWMNGSWQRIQFLPRADAASGAMLRPNIPPEPRPEEAEPRAMWAWYLRHGEESLGDRLGRRIDCPVEHDHSHE